MLKRDDVKQEVFALQESLVKKGFNLSIDGIFGLRTEAAVRNVQQYYSLAQDGIVGPQTLAVLKDPQKITTGIPINYCYKVPYYSQRDNDYEPSATCNVTSLAMVMAYWGISSSQKQLEDELYIVLQMPEALDYYKKAFPSLYKANYKIQTVHGMLGWLVKQKGFNWSYTEKGTWEDFKTASYPLIVSGQFTKSGHIIVVCGMTTIGDLIVHDPYGDWYSGYKNPNGQYRIYSKKDMLDVLANTITNKRIHKIWR